MMARQRNNTSSSRRKPMKHRRRYDLFLNRYDDMAFTRCPKCENTTKLRKFPLVIHIEPNTMFVLNKTCRFCPSCELLIVHQREIEPMMAATFSERDPEIVGNDFLLLGTMERADWRLGNKGELNQSDTADRLILFRKHMDFEIRGGWGPAD